MILEVESLKIQVVQRIKTMLTMQLQLLDMELRMMKNGLNIGLYQTGQMKLGNYLCDL